MRALLQVAAFCVLLFLPAAICPGESYTLSLLVDCPDRPHASGGASSAMSKHDALVHLLAHSALGGSLNVRWSRSSGEGDAAAGPAIVSTSERLPTLRVIRSPLRAQLGAIAA